MEQPTASDDKPMLDIYARLISPTTFRDDLEESLTTEMNIELLNADGPNPPACLEILDESFPESEQKKQVRLSSLNSLPNFFARIRSRVEHLIFDSNKDASEEEDHFDPNLRAHDLALVLRQTQNSLKKFTIANTERIVGTDEELRDFQDLLGSMATLKSISCSLAPDDTRGWNALLGALPFCHSLEEIYLDNVPNVYRARIESLFSALQTNQSTSSFKLSLNCSTFYRLSSLDDPLPVLRWDDKLTSTVAKMLSCNTSLQSFELSNNTSGSLAPIAEVFASCANTSIKHFSWPDTYLEKNIDALAKALETNYHIQSIRKTSHARMWAGPIQDERIQFFLRQNRSGVLKRLYESDSTTTDDWIHAVIDHCDDLSSMYYYLSKNPSIIDQIRPCKKLCRTLEEAMTLGVEENLIKSVQVNEQAGKAAALCKAMKQGLSISLKQAPEFQGYSDDQLNTFITVAIAGATTATAAAGLLAPDE